MTDIGGTGRIAGIGAKQARSTATVSTEREKLLAALDGFFGALEHGDIGRCKTYFTDDAVIWHNYDQLEHPKDLALDALAHIAYLNPRFEVGGRDLLGNTCFQRHTVVLQLPQGRVVRFPAMQRIEFVGNRIARIDEYLDSAQIAAAADALPPSYQHQDQTVLLEGA